MFFCREKGSVRAPPVPDFETEKIQNSEEK